MIGDPTYQKEFENRYSLYLSRIQEVQDLILFCANQTEQLEFRNVEDKVIYTFFRQIIETYNSILILSGNGFARNSAQVLRSMYEHCVTMSYLKKLYDYPVRSTIKKPFPDSIEKFLDFIYVNQRKQVNKLREFFPEEFSNEDIERFEREYKAVENKFEINDCKKCGTKRINHQWSANSIIAMANEVDLDKHLTFYCYLQALTISHPSANSIQDRWILNEDNTISYQFESEMDERKTLLYSHLMLLISIETLLSHFQIEVKDDLLKKHSILWEEIWF